MSPHGRNLWKIVRTGEIVQMYPVCSVMRLGMWPFTTNLFLGHDNKCEFCLEQVAFFDKIISKDRLAIDPLKVKAIVNCTVQRIWQRSRVS